MNVSIVIPTFNESASITRLVTYLIANSNDSVNEIIIADGGSEDDTIIKAKNAGALAFTSPKKGRAAQMNYGASMATGDILYFVHADCIPPATFITDIRNAIAANYDLGRYRTQFDSDKPLLKFNAWFTRFDLFMCMGADQTLFIKRKLFEFCQGFKEEMTIMEEYEFCKRARETGRYIIMPGAALVSARKYLTNSWIKVQLANAKIFYMYNHGASQKEMTDAYSKMLSYRKNAF